MIEERSLSFWSLEGGERGVGNASLLDKPLTAFFASRQCPGVAIRTTMTWAVEQARSKSPAISGFHSPLEQSVLEVLLTVGAPCVMDVLLLTIKNLAERSFYEIEATNEGWSVPVLKRQVAGTGGDVWS